MIELTPYRTPIESQKRVRTYLFPVGIGFWSQEVSKGLSFLFVGIIAVLTMWFTVSSTENVVENFRFSSAVNLELREALIK